MTDKHPATYNDAAGGNIANQMDRYADSPSATPWPTPSPS